MFNKKLKNMLEAYSFVLRILLKSSGMFSFLYIFIHILTAIFPSLIVYLSGKTLDGLLDIYNGGSIITVWKYIVMLFLLAIFNALFSQTSSVLNDFIRVRNDKKLNMIILDKFSRLEFHYFEQEKQRNDMDVVMYSQFSISRSFIVSVEIIQNIVKFVSLALVIIIYNPLLAVFYLVTTIPGIVVTMNQNKKLDRFSIDSIPDAREKDYYYSILTNKTYAKDVRIFNLFDVFKDKYNRKWKDILSQRANIFKRSFLRELLTNGIGIIGYVVLYAVLIWKTVNGEYSIGELTAFISATISIASCFQLIVHSISTYTTIFVPRIRTTMDFLNWEDESSGSILAENINNVEIEFQNVTFRYPGTEKEVLHNLSFKINKNEKIAIVGVNGAGKTTIVKLLLRFYEPSEGEILMNGINIKEYDLESYRRIFSACFQNPTLYSMSLGENVALSDIEHSYDQNKIWSAIDNSGLTFENDVHVTAETPLTRNFDSQGIELSGGQRQKLAISRAFFRNAPFIILDEPSSALDPKAEDHIFRSFSKLCGQKSGILISHRLSNIIMVDRIIHIEDGRVIEEGTHEALMLAGGRYSEMYHLQADKYELAYNHQKDDIKT